MQKIEYINLLLTQERDHYDSEEHAVEIYTETMNLIDEWIDELETQWK